MVMNGRVVFNKFTSIPSNLWRTTQSVRKFAHALQRCFSHVWNLIVIRPSIMMASIMHDCHVRKTLASTKIFFFMGTPSSLESA
jgi:hypothetical protein